MVIRQAYNGRTKRYVKYQVDEKGWRVKDVKQKDPKKPFKGIPIKGKRK